MKTVKAWIIGVCGNECDGDVKWEEVFETEEEAVKRCGELEAEFPYYFTVMFEDDVDIDWLEEEMNNAS